MDDVFIGWLTGIAVGYLIGSWVTFYLSPEERQKRRERKHAREFTERLNKAAGAMMKDPEWQNQVNAIWGENGKPPQ